ncbi:4-hydroxybutyrate dehydrogenase [Clostridiaceae bacterium 35-E11]
MKEFAIHTKIVNVDTFVAFAEQKQLTKKDLIITNEFIYEPFMKSCNVPCKFIFQEKYGSGEPSDQMIDAIRKDIPSDVTRVIAVGGGTVIDIAKVLTFVGEWATEEIFTGKIVPKKERGLIVIPTTCGTGSEVTNITIAELKNLKTKKGLALESMYPDEAVLIPEMIKTLPYKFFATSSIDAMIHAVESYLSPKATAHSEEFSISAINKIIHGYKYVVENGQTNWIDKAKEFLVASNYAGIAFGNAGCAAVHALSYPLGGMYHIPHGEANMLMFAAVLKKYKEKKAVGKLNELEKLFADALEVKEEEGLVALYDLMEKILSRKPLREYGIKEEELAMFSASVIEGQQRLLNNNYVELTEAEMTEIYKRCF